MRRFAAVTELYDRDAELYDIAFDWDVGEEVEWLCSRLGASCRSVLEPGCGSGRMLEALARRGLAVTGVDRSPGMLAVARRRLERAGLEASLVEADITRLDLGRRFDGAVCPINTLAHLSPDELELHLACMAAALAPQAAYLVQLALGDPGDPDAAPAPSIWEAERDGVRLAIEWSTERVDPLAAREIQRSQIEVLAGPEAGRVLVERHEMTWWTPPCWHDTVRRARLRLTATYDGARPGRPRVEPGATGGLLWHELRAPAA